MLSSERYKIAFAFFLCLVFIPLGGYPLDPSEKLVFEKNTLYQYIAVIEDTDQKIRYIRNQKRDFAQGGILINEPEKLLFEFTQMVFVSLAFIDRAPEDVLFIGLGAGTMPRYLKKYYPDAFIDIAEIDPDILAAAKDYFYFREDEKTRVHIDDGRLFIKRAQKKYDIIFIDVYQYDYIPFHLATLEFLKEARSILKENGVLVSNIAAQPDSKLLDSMVVTYKKAFPNLYLFKAKNTGNFIFVATAGDAVKTRKDIVKRAHEIQALKKYDFDLEEIASRLEDSGAHKHAGAKIFTDDFAPVNLYKYQRSELK